MKERSFVFILAFLCVFSFKVTTPWAKVYIDIESPSFRKFPIAITYFTNVGGGDKKESISLEIFGVLCQDLEFSGLFNLIDPSHFIEAGGEDPESDNDGKIDFNDWSIIGAEVLIKGSFCCNGDDLKIEAKLYDVFRGQFILGKRYVGNRQDLRRMIHKFSDEIMLSFTGEKGVFDTKIAFVLRESTHKEIYIMDFDGYDMRKVTDHRSIAVSPTWSPNGNKIAFTSYKKGNPDIYVKDLISNKEDRISRYGGLNIAPAWAPDGERMAVTLSVNGNSEIYLVDVHGKKLKRLTKNWGIDVSPTWAPDGKKIAFVSNQSGNPNIYVMDSQGGNVRRLTFQTRYSVSPDWSPRGNKIAFCSLEGGCFHICTMNPDGTDVRRLTTADSGNNEDPSWSPDGRFITFTSTRDGKKSIYIMRTDGNGQKRVRTFNGRSSNPCWSPRFH